MQKEDLRTDETGELDKKPGVEKKAEAKVKQKKLEQVVLLENQLKQVRILCDEICKTQPDNFLFFTQYGGDITPEKLKKDKKTDIDLRLICFSIPHPDEQEKIFNRFKALKSIGILFPIELYFHSFDEYIAGKVGETGSVTNLDVIDQGLDPEKVTTKIENSSLVALYTFATMRFFTEKSDDEFTTWINQVAENRKQSGDKVPDNFNLDNLRPENILKEIKLDKEGIIEWIHMYLKYFINDYKKYRLSLEKDDLNKDQELASYIMRLSKYLVRIAFGVAIINSDDTNINGDYTFIRNYYIDLLKGGVQADLAHFSILTDQQKSWIDDETLRILGDATTQRQPETDKLEAADEEQSVMGQLEIDDDQKQAELDKLRIINTQKKHDFENSILYIAQQAGGILRRETFNDIHDFLTEFSILSSLELRRKEHSGVYYLELEKGETLINEGDKSDKLFLVPKNKSDGSKNGQYSLKIDGVITPLAGNKSIVGEIGLLSNSMRTVSIIADDDLEVFVIDKQLIEDILGSTVSTKEGKVSPLRYYLSGYFDQEKSLEEKKKNLLLIYSFLNYFSSEFIQYVYERVETGHVFNKTRPEQAHMLSSYKIEDFAKILLKISLQENISKGFVKTKSTDKPRILFSAGSSDDNYLYVVTDTDSNAGGISVQISSKDGSSSDVLFGKNEIIGESSLLPDKRPRNYTAVVMPGTTVMRISVSDFQNITMTTDLYQLFIDGKSVEVTGAELFFHLGAVLLSRLQSFRSV